MNIIKSFFSNSTKFNALKDAYELLNAKYKKLIDMHEALKENHATHIGRLEDALLQAETPVTTKALTKLTFNARLPGGSTAATEFVLGLGRCGKTVESLDLTRTDKLFIIKQWHTDGSFKNFTYELEDLEGRVQECYEVVTVTPGSYYSQRVRDTMDWERRQRVMHRRF